MVRIGFHWSLFVGLLLVVTTCSSIEPTTRATLYPDMYEEKPVAILLMPPINRSLEPEAKEFFHSTLHVPLSNRGFYVIPPFLSMEILKKESAYDAELFLDQQLSTFGEVFGADAVLFTIIHNWSKSKLSAEVIVEIEYVLKSTHTNKIMFQRRGDVTYDTSVSSGLKGAFGFIVDLAATAVNTSVTDNVRVARDANTYSLNQMPVGKYSPLFGKDSTWYASDKPFSVQLNKE